MPHTRKIPMRICIGCGEQKPKKEMIRIVRDPEGKLSIDRTGKKSGRGAYICDNPACLDKAASGGGIERALETPVTAELLDALRKELTVG